MILFISPAPVAIETFIFNSVGNERSNSQGREPLMLHKKVNWDKDKIVSFQ